MEPAAGKSIDVLRYLLRQEQAGYSHHRIRNQNRKNQPLNTQTCLNREERSEDDLGHRTRQVVKQVELALADAAEIRTHDCLTERKRDI